MPSENRTTMERRVFERFASSFPAKFKDTREDYGANVYLTNASGKGMRLLTKKPLHFNDEITVEVKLPDKGEPMAIQGQVVWAKNKEQNLWDVGLRFHDISLMHISRLYRAATGNEP